MGNEQDLINSYFHKEARYWAEIYARDGTRERIHHQRLRLALGMASELRLSPGEHALDVGCGAGLGAVGLARRGFLVEALDPVQSMIEATRNYAIKAGTQSLVRTRVGDIHGLPFSDGSFAVVLALGVLPWLPQIGRPLREIYRVLRPGGSMIVSIDTKWQLREIFDPLMNPSLAHPRKFVSYLLRRRRSEPPVRAYRISLKAFRRVLKAEGFEEQRGVTLGFGPFTFFGREVLPDVLGRKLHDWLQAIALEGAPILRSLGSQHLVLARKIGSEDDMRASAKNVRSSLVAGRSPYAVS